jgi:hypothetical protein
MTGKGLAAAFGQIVLVAIGLGLGLWYLNEPGVAESIDARWLLGGFGVLIAGCIGWLLYRQRARGALSVARAVLLSAGALALVFYLGLAVFYN